MSITQTLDKWLTVEVDEESINRQAREIRLLFEALTNQGFNEEQALKIVVGVCASNRSDDLDI